MKKYLLLAAAALVAVSVSAQKISKKSDASVKKSATKEFVANKAVKAQFGSIRMLPQLRENTPIMTINGEKIVKAENKKFSKSATASRRAFAAAYNGTCGGSAGSQKWTLTPTTVKDESEQEYAAFEDLLPAYFNGLDHTYVLYSINGTAITVPAQYLVTLTMASGAKYDVWISNFTASSVDGSMDLTIAEDGELTMGAPYIAYVALPEGTKEFSFDDMVTYFVYFESIKYKDASVVSAPAVSYTSEDAIFYSGIANNGYSFVQPRVLLPAYAPVSFTNLTTDDADTWSWQAYTLNYQEGATEEEDGKWYNDKLVAEAATRDFSFTTEGGELYAAPILKGSYQGMESDPYTGFNIGEDEDGNTYVALAYGGASASNWVFEDGTAPIVSRADLRSNSLEGISSASETSRYSGLVFYQGKPAAPFYFEGVNMLVYNFVKVADVVKLTCKIYKVERDESGVPSLGELVAESDLDQTSLEPSSWQSTAQLKWNTFKATDETGTVFNIDHFFIDYDFAVVIDGWNNGTFTGMAIGDSGEANCTISNTSVIVASNGKESGLAYYGHAFIGFDEATYGYLYTTDDTNLTIAETGGQASIHVEPMLYSKNSETEEYSTRLFFEEAITDTDLDDDYDEDGFPVWLQAGFANEVYTDEASSFDLVLEAEALPAGVEGRAATITFYQEGARLTVTVTQGQVSGITAAKTNVKVNTNASMFNLAGQRVNKDFKGIVVKNGRKAVVK